MIEKITTVATDVVGALKKEPISLVLILINLLFLVAFYFTIHEISQSAERRDSLLSEVAKSCLSK